MKILQRLKSPTPKVWRQLGNAFVAVSAAISGYSAYCNEPTISMISMICGVVGKFLSSFFVEDNTEV